MLNPDFDEITFLPQVPQEPALQDLPAARTVPHRPRQARRGRGRAQGKCSADRKNFPYSNQWYILC